ncbi:MAG: YbaK/EbsC family protein [Acidimicrobiia bacterium]|nr:YbaK/EbsC family protein [Acidimicrobiia bacterium]NNK92464.1 YbaK/EbsC family protein [Acidimicrobiia bacterium]
MLPDATVRFLAAAADVGLDPDPTVYPDGTKTAADAAAAIGCDVAQIVKSLVFMVDDEPVLVLMPGDLRLDTQKLGLLLGGTARRADLDEVRRFTGYAAGGTPPFGHVYPIPVYADGRLARHPDLWAAAGTPTTVFPIAHDDLLRVTGAASADLAESR